MRRPILLSGSLAIDRIMDFPGFFKDCILPDKIHALNVSFLVKTFSENFGGTAGNIAYNLALLRAKPVVLGSVGKDFLAYRLWLERHKVVTRYVNVIGNQPTASAYMITDQNDNQISSFFPGAGGHSTQTPPRAVLKAASFGCVSPTGIGDMRNFPKVFKRHNIRYAYDPGQQLTSLNKADLVLGSRGAEILFSNDYEFNLFLKKSGLVEKELLRQVKIVVTTLGPKGSVIQTANKRVRIPPAKPHNTSDPTGAGDAFRAGFVHGYVKGLTLEECGRLGSVVSVYTVEKYGTQTHKFTPRELESRYRKNYRQRIRV